MTSPTSAFDLVRTVSGAELTSWVIAAADALQDFHDDGRVHTALTPAMILVEVDANGHRRARLAPSREPARPGTRHCAPELAGDRSPTPASDVYSLAASLYTLLAKHPPPPPNAPGPFPDPAVALTERGIPEGIAIAVRRAMAPDPSRRPPAAGFAAELRAAVTALAATLPDAQTHDVVEAVLGDAAEGAGGAGSLDDRSTDEIRVLEPRGDGQRVAEDDTAEDSELVGVSERSAILFEPAAIPAPLPMRNDAVQRETDLFAHNLPAAPPPRGDRTPARAASIEWLAPALSFSGITMLLAAIAITVASLA